MGGELAESVGELGEPPGERRFLLGGEVEK